MSHEFRKQYLSKNQLLKLFLSNSKVFLTQFLINSLTYFKQLIDE